MPVTNQYAKNSCKLKKNKEGEIREWRNKASVFIASVEEGPCKVSFSKRYPNETQA